MGKLVFIFIVGVAVGAVAMVTQYKSQAESGSDEFAADLEYCKHYAEVRHYNEVGIGYCLEDRNKGKSK